MKLKSWLFSLLLSLTFLSDLFGATYYMGQGPGDSDANSCITAQTNADGSRKLTFASATACLVSGDTLAVKAGTYTSPTTAQMPPSGTSWTSPTTVTNVGSDIVNLNGALTIATRSFLIFNGFRIDQLNNAATEQGVFIGNNSHHIRIINNDIKNVYTHGILSSVLTGGTGNNEIINNVIHDGGLCPYPTTCSFGLNAIYMSTPNNIIERNEITHWRHAGIQIYTGDANRTNGNIVRYNWIHDTGGNYPVNNEGAQPIILMDGDNMQAYGNVISNMFGVGNVGYNAAFQTQRADNTQIYNNTVYNSIIKGVQLTDISATNAKIKNNIFRTLSTEVPFDDNGTGNVKSNNLCDAAATGCSTTADPLFKNTSVNDFNLLAGSPCIDAGIDVGLPFNGSAPDCGALEAPTYGSSSATTGTNTISVPMINNAGVVAGVGMRNCTAGNFALVVDGTSRTSSSCTVVGNNQLNLVFSGATVTTSATVAYTAGTLSDSFCIGATPGSASCKNGEVRTFAAQTVTVSGGSTTVYTQTRGRFHLITGAENSPTLWNCAENQNCTIQVGGSERIRLKVKIDTATPPAIGLSLWANENSGTYFSVADTFGANNIQMYGNVGNINVTNGQSTTIQLTVDAANAIAGTILRTAQATPSISGCTIPCEREEEFAVTIASGAGVLNRIFCFQLRKDDGTVLNTYTSTPCMTAINSSLNKALGGVSLGGGVGK